MYLPTVFPWFRYLFWFFQGDYYRTYSLFCDPGVDHPEHDGFLALHRRPRSESLGARRDNSCPRWESFTCRSRIAEPASNPDLKLQATIFLIFYGALLAAGQLLKRPRLAAWLIVGLARDRAGAVSIESPFPIARPSPSRSSRSRVGYNDETVDAVRDIKASDDSFFRITKLRHSGPSVWTSFNDAMVFGYYGTSSYSSFNNLNYTNFLTAVDAIPPNSETDTRWSVGLLGNPILSMFACEKYALVPDPARFQTAVQYEFVKRYGKDHLFRNKHVSPPWPDLRSSIPEDRVPKLPGDERQEVLLGVVVLADKDTAGKHGISQITMSELEQQMKATSLPADVAKRRDERAEPDLLSAKRTSKAPFASINEAFWCCKRRLIAAGVPGRTGSPRRF